MRAEAPPRPRRRRWRLAARSATPLLAAGLLAGWFLAAPRREEVRGHPRIRALLARAPAGSRVGLLLPLRDLGAPGRGWSRDGAELWDAFPAQRPRIPLWVRGGYARLYERSERAALERSGGCDLAVYAVAPAEAGALADDALLFLVDLPSYRLRAATPVNDPAVVELAGRLGVLDGAATPDPLVVLPSLDAARRVSNRSLAWFDACLTANLVERLRRVSLRARGGLEPRLAAFAGDARRALSVGTTLRCVYDHAAGRLVATVRDAARGKELYSCEVPLRLSGYDPLQDAGAFSADPRAVALAREADPRRALARGLEQARALLFEQDPGRALEVLEAVRARGLPVADDPDLLLLLARAQRELGQRAEARALLAEALRSHPEVAAVREAYAREVLDAARRRYRQGKRPWYADDDEERFREAIELLKPTRDLEVSEDLRRDLDAWMRRLEGEL
ncbi:MAG: hypothetical protein D6731_09340 [Planctomycetota bacterium]|nr:MAG: hypothetical protein D6731_09340 [Planctomycetota bacterium]